MATKGANAFIDEYTRKLMTDLCLSQVVYGDPYSGLTGNRIEKEHFLAHAVTKKWLSADRSRILAAGWSTAARFLRR